MLLKMWQILVTSCFKCEDRKDRGWYAVQMSKPHFAILGYTYKIDLNLKLVLKKADCLANV